MRDPLSLHVLRTWDATQAISDTIFYSTRLKAYQRKRQEELNMEKQLKHSHLHRANSPILQMEFN